MSAAAKFCPECAHPVASAAAEPRYASPDSYTPKHLAEKILVSKSALEGERKQVTVLFADIVESSRLAEQLDPEGMHAVMDRVLRLMADGVHRYEGTVNQFLGDGIMALFGAPVALEDHPYRAVQAALAIRETVSGYSEVLRRERGLEIRLRLGLNSGLVVVGRIGDDLRMDYTAIGDTTHLAARMQELAEPGSILVTEATHRLVEDYVRTEPGGRVTVRGRPDPVAVFRVTGRRRRRSRFEVHAEAGLTDLVGRERELAVLEDRFARATAGRGQGVGIVGEPGVGKSRLLYELHKALSAERIVWLEGHCVAYGQSTPYLPILEILRTNFQIEEGDNPLQIEEKLRQGVRRLDPGLDRIIPSLGELLGAPAGAPELAHLDARERRQRTFEAIRALTMAGCARRPHVLIIEDLHWIDRTSEEYLASLIESLAGVPALVVTTVRPGYTVRWAEKTYYTQIALDVLTEEEVSAMVGRLLGVGQPPVALVRRIQEKAEGNPLFVEEITTSLVERGLVRRQNGGVAWASDAGVEFPGTVQDIIRARLDRLEDPVKRTVQTAAVIGRQFGLALLTRVSEIADEVRQYLETLKHLELVHETRIFPELEYIFKHAVIQDVAYQSLLEQRRRELHGAIAQAIEELYGDRLDDQAVILAYHYARSREPGRSIRYALLAGDRAARLYANAEAAGYYQQALATARALPRSPEAERAEIDAALKLATVSVTRQDMERDQANLSTAEEFAERQQDQPRLAQVRYWLGRVQYVLGNPAGAIAYAEQSLEIADGLGDEALGAPAVNLIGRVAWQQGAFRKAARMLERSAEQMRRLGNRADEATTTALAGLAYAWVGEARRAGDFGDAGVRVAEELGNPFTRAGTYHFRGGIRVVFGDWARAVEDLQRARQIAESVGDLFRIHIAKCWEGQAWSIGGDHARGRLLLEEGLALGKQIGTQFDLARHQAWLAGCLLALGEGERAEQLCTDAIRLAEETGDALGASLAQRALAEGLIATSPNRLNQAETLLVEAIRTLEAEGIRPELARTYEVHARVIAASGRRETARQVLTKAIELFSAMEATADLERCQRALAAISTGSVHE